MSNERRKTGMRQLDAILGGGFLPGLVYIRGGCDVERFAQQLATAIDANNRQSDCLCIERTLWRGDLALHFLRTARARDTVCIAYSHGPLGITPDAMDAADVILHFDRDFLRVDKNRGGGLGVVRFQATPSGGFVECDAPEPTKAPCHLCEAGICSAHQPPEIGAFVGHNTPSFAEIERAAIQAADAADRVMGALSPEARASLYTPMLNPEFAAATDAAFREGEAHAWASAVRVADRYVGVFDDPEQVAIVDAILRDLRAVAKGRA